MTSGELLKEKLSLKKLRFVKITSPRIGSSQRIYMIFYDSARPNMPIASSRMLNSPYTAMIFNGASIGKRPNFGVIQLLEEFNGPITGALFITVDLAGDLKISRKNLQNSFEVCSKFLEEAFRIEDIRKNSVSKRNIEFLKKRKEEGNPGSFLDSVKWDTPSDRLKLIFRSNPTYPGSVNVISTKGTPGTDDMYTVEVEFEKVSDFLGTKSEYLAIAKSAQQTKVLSLLKDGLVRLHSNDYSFYYQGVWEMLTKTDTNIYDFPGPSGKGKWAELHVQKSEGFYITKHIFEVLQVIANNWNTIAKLIRESLEGET